MWDVICLSVGVYLQTDVPGSLSTDRRLNAADEPLASESVRRATGRGGLGMS